MAIADDDVERVRMAQPISAVIGNYVALKRAGRNFLGLCPFHGEKTPSFNVRDETGRYKCFGCGASGDVFKFVQEAERMDFVGAIEHLAAKHALTKAESGRILQTLIDASRSDDCAYDIVHVISNRPDAYGLTRAEQAGIRVEMDMQVA